MAAVAFGPASSFGQYSEDFNLETSGSTLQSLFGWSKSGGGPTDFTLDSGAGYSSTIGLLDPGGIAAETGHDYFRTLTSSEVANADNGLNYVFRTKVRLLPGDSAQTTEDQGMRAHLWLLEDDAASGGSTGLNGILVAKFNGSGLNADPTSNNSIGVSQGGAHWGNQTQVAAQSAPWLHDTWYQLDFSFSLQPNTPGTTGEDVTGTLNIWEVSNPATKIVDNFGVQGFGQNTAHPLNLINKIRIQSWNLGPTDLLPWNVDDLSLMLAGDLNGDGFVGLSDLNLVLGNWNQNVTLGDWAMGDPSNDGFVGLSDLNLVLGNWNQGVVPSASQALAAVPEPMTAGLMSLGALGFMLRRRRVCGFA